MDLSEAFSDLASSSFAGRSAEARFNGSLSKAALLGDQGLFSQAHEVFEEGLNAVRGANHEVEASVLGWQSAVYLWQGRWEDALRCANAGQHVAERVKSHFIFATDHAMSRASMSQRLGSAGRFGGMAPPDPGMSMPCIP